MAQAFQLEMSRHGKLAAAVLPFASTALSSGGNGELYATLAKALDVS
jgi:hypothetical protein